MSSRGIVSELDLERLAAEALDELLATARLQTIEAWCETGATFGLRFRHSHWRVQR